ncbi:MAG: sigma-70 family RNA polymerase sigma factor [Lachnospiraceae bacterium]|nr:sigma-70 family RNA polymerase sigma factor [Lachnospiraceae bacterium]
MRGRDEIVEGREIITDLYNNHRGMAYRIVKDVLGQQISPEEEDDLVQEGFYQMLKHLENLLGRNKKEYFRYMCSTMLHLAINEGRRRSGCQWVSFTDVLESGELMGLPIYWVDLEDRIISEAERSEVNGILYQALAELNQQEYDLIVGYYFFEISDQKMGDWLGLKTAFVRIYRKRALKKLAKKYKEIVERQRCHT